MYGLIVLNVGVAVLTMFSDYEAVFRDFGFIPSEPSWASVLTSMFLHGSLWHLLGNMFFLWMFGDNVEDVLGAFGFLALYLATGVAAVGSHWALNSDSSVPTIGASGAISGIVGAYVVFFPRMPIDLVVHIFWWEIKTIRVTTAGAVGAWFSEQLLFGVLTVATGLKQYIGIAFWAHIGGVLAGVLLGVALARLGYLRRYASADTPRNPLLGYVGGPRRSARRPVSPR